MDDPLPLPMCLKRLIFMNVDLYQNMVKQQHNKTAEVLL